MHVLLIEPDVILARIYQQTFERVGCTVVHARSAAGAIEAADSRRPDLVVLEMQLAGHSGAAFLYEFRSYSDWVGIPIIVHTLIPPDSLRVFEQTFYELGIGTVLYKPQTSLRKLLSVADQYAPEVA